MDILHKIIELVIKMSAFKNKKNPSSSDFTDKFYQTFKGQIIIHQKLNQKNRGRMKTSKHILSGYYY